MFRSLRWRMAASHALVLLVILLVLGGGVLLLLSRSLYRSATNDLRSAAQSQAEAIRESGEVGPPADSDVPSAASVQVAVYGMPGAQLVGEPTEVPTWLKRYPNEVDRKSTRLNSSHFVPSRMPSSA